MLWWHPEREAWGSPPQQVSKYLPSVCLQIIEYVVLAIPSQSGRWFDHGRKGTLKCRNLLVSGRERWVFRLESVSPCRIFV